MDQSPFASRILESGQCCLLPAAFLYVIKNILLTKAMAKIKNMGAGGRRVAGGETDPPPDPVSHKGPAWGLGA